MKKLVLVFIICSIYSGHLISQNMLAETYNLMPWPKAIEENPAKFIINSDVTISINPDNNGRVRNAGINFLRRLSTRTAVFLDKGFPLKNKKGNIHIDFDTVSILGVENDESYSLAVNDTSINIKAKTDIGAIRGLETLLQLTHNDETNYFFPGVSINDEPRFVWRGLMIDVARHFQPIDVLKRNLDAMASVKMNVFHWHLTDDQGFKIGRASCRERV